MDTTNGLQTSITDYKRICELEHKKPTYNGLGTYLGISGQTIRNVVSGYYKGNMTYTDRPHVNRCIYNDDFEIVRSLFS